MLHCRIHRNEPRCVFRCESSSCRQTFCTYASFKCHFYRKHNVPTSPVRGIMSDFVCAVSLCTEQFQTVQELVVHLKKHLVEGRSVNCPVAGCQKTFTLKSSFTAHLSRKHPDCSVNNINDLYRAITPQSSATAVEEVSQVSDQAEDLPASSEPTQVSDEIFLRSVCLFYLKLQGQLLLPDSTIQVIVEEMQNLHELGLDYTLSKLHSLMKDELNLTDDVVRKVSDCIEDSDLFSSTHKGPLRTAYSRAQTFKRMFKYVQPKVVRLGYDDDMRQRNAYYIPVKQTLINLLETQFWKNSLLQQTSTEADECVLSDTCDGQAFKSNPFFIANPGGLQLILYQDAFEVVNPLGSAKKKHKVLAVYLSVANLPVHVRSNTDHMSLVLLCGENDLKEFGCAKVFANLITDLSDLTENGITVGEETVRGALYCVAGDNLGSHGIGGFNENFTSCYFCRYCEVTRDDFKKDPNLCGRQRTPYSYDAAVSALSEESRDIHGIKQRSVFNDVANFHVCQPGLPPCLGHDIFEGVLSYDLGLYLNYFIKTKKWFTYTLLNRRIKQFQFKGSDALSKPCTVQPGALKLSGNAVQNWNFLRLLPVLIGDKVQNADDDVWQLTLLLKDIVDLVCAQKISVTQVAYLEIIVQEYLDSRMCLFPHSTLKPKHHYMRHYPSLILKFGPLIRLWTMRFESKHSYFKRCARHLKNFKNICRTLCERHQMFQAYVLAGLGSSEILQIKNGCAFIPNLYNDSVNHAASEFGFSERDTVVSTEIQYKGTTYKKGDFLVVNESMEFGKIIIILNKDDAVYVLMDLHKSNFLPKYHLYAITPQTTAMKCVNLQAMLDFYPLTSYIIDAHRVIPLKHSILSM